MQDRKRLEESLHERVGTGAREPPISTPFSNSRAKAKMFSAIWNREIKSFSERLDGWKTRMLLSGPNDASSAIMAIHPGAGGTESQDWAEMLLRMYLRWAERDGFQTVVTDRLEGEGAGIKSATFEINGENAYGLLQSEIGVHRLVRISPFDANARRHTSFASVFVYPQIEDDVKIDSNRTTCKVDVFRASGRRRPACQPDRIRRAHDAHPDRSRGAVPERALAAQESRQRHETTASATLYEFEMAKKRVEQDKLEDTKLEINFGSQIRSYVLAPYRLIKDHRTKLSVGDVDRVLDGDMDSLIHAFLVWKKTGKTASDGKPDGKEDLPD